MLNTGSIGNLLLFTLGGFLVVLLSRFYPNSVRFCDDVPKPYKPIYCGQTLSAGHDADTGEILVATSWRSAVEHQLGAVETWLNTQQPMSLPYIQEMVRIAIAARRPRILVMGLGGGAMPFLLHRFCSYCNVTAVDVELDALQIARQFVHADDGVRTIYIRDDAFKFAAAASVSSFDVVMDDVYIGYSRPETVQSLQYLQILYEILAPGGQYVVNICTPVNQPSRAADVLQKQLEGIFDRVSQLIVPRTQNVIVIASKV